MKQLLFSVAVVVILIQALPSHASVFEVEAFVTRFYQQCLNRNPDQPGLNYWTNSLLSGNLTGADVAYGFVFSPEFTSLNTSNEDFLALLYRAFFDREADPGGWNYWLEQLNSGTSREDVLNGYLHSLEFYHLCVSHGIRPNPVSAFVWRFYEQCLNREPDPDGLYYWANTLVSHSITGSDVALGFVFSPEFTTLNMSDEDFLTVLFRVFFDRDPDPGGWNYWLGKLNTFASREYVVDGFVGSDEFIALCNAYGVDPFCNSGSFFPRTSGHWRYRVNGGQPVTAYYDGVTMTMQLNDIEMSTSPHSPAMHSSLTGTVSAEGYSGNVSASFETLHSPEIMDMQFDLGGFGEYVGVEIHLGVNYDAPIHWFLGRCDLDKLPLGYFYDAQGLVWGTGNGFIRIYGDLVDYQPINNVYVSVPTDSWQIVDKLPSYTVNGVTYQNVVVVERYTEVQNYDLVGSENVTMVYWVAKGVGMIKAANHFRIFDEPLVTELVSVRVP